MEKTQTDCSAVCSGFNAVFADFGFARQVDLLKIDVDSIPHDALLVALLSSGLGAKVHRAAGSRVKSRHFRDLPIGKFGSPYRHGKL